MFEIPDIQLNQYGKPARIMFLAPYAPDAPDFSKKPYTGNGGYPQYHYNIYKAIQDIGYDVVSSSKPYSVQFAKGNVDYVFSLMNRFAMSGLKYSFLPTANSFRFPTWAPRPTSAP